MTSTYPDRELGLTLKFSLLEASGDQSYRNEFGIIGIWLGELV